MSRRRRNTLIITCFLLASSVVALDIRKGKQLRKAILRTSQEADDFRKYHNKTFTVINIVDGDTFDINISDGQYGHTRIRLLGIDTPETKGSKYPAMYYGKEAEAFAAQLALNKQVTVLLDEVSGTRGKYGRLLAHLKLPDGRLINDELLRNGCAYADLRFKNNRFQRYVNIQQEAITARAGLWQEVDKHQLPQWLQRERPDILDF